MKIIDRKSLRLLVISAAAGAGAYFGHRAAGSVGIAAGVFVMWCASNRILR